MDNLNEAKMKNKANKLNKKKTRIIEEMLEHFNHNFPKDNSQTAEITRDLLITTAEESFESVF